MAQTSVHEVLQARRLSGCCFSLGELPHPGIDPTSLMSPAPLRRPEKRPWGLGVLRLSGTALLFWPLPSHCSSVSLCKSQGLGQDFFQLPHPNSPPPFLGMFCLKKNSTRCSSSCFIPPFSSQTSTHSVENRFLNCSVTQFMILIKALLPNQAGIDQRPDKKKNAGKVYWAHCCSRRE